MPLPQTNRDINHMREIIGEIIRGDVIWANIILTDTIWEKFGRS